MPTGYTAAVADGTVTDLVPFAMQLARGMGATIMMRDDPWDKPIPERFEPSTYNAERLAAVIVERDRLTALTDAEAQAEADRENAEYAADRATAKAEWITRRERYLAMIAKVEAWAGAPDGVKEFGLEQLNQGLRFDCGELVLLLAESPPRDGVEWRKRALEKVWKDIEYHTVEDAKERVRTDGRNAWLAQLRRSLASVE